MTSKKITEMDDIPESYQEYIESIYRIYLSQKKTKKNEDNFVSNSAIASHMNYKASSVTNMLRKLSDKDLIKWTPRNKKIKYICSENI